MSPLVLKGLKIPKFLSIFCIFKVGSAKGDDPDGQSIFRYKNSINTSMLFFQRG